MMATEEEDDGYGGEDPDSNVGAAGTGGKSWKELFNKCIDKIIVCWNINELNVFNHSVLELITDLLLSLENNEFLIILILFLQEVILKWNVRLCYEHADAINIISKFLLPLKNRISQKTHLKDSSKQMLFNYHKFGLFSLKHSDSF